MTLTHSLKIVIVEKVDLTPPSDGKIYVVCNRGNATPNKHYDITFEKYPISSRISFLKVHNPSIGARQPYVPCKHMYNLFLLVLHADEEGR